MIKPVSRGDAFLKNVAGSMKTSQRLHIWWLGHSAFLIQWNGEHLLLDPFLSERLTAPDGEELERVTEPVVEPGLLDFIDVIAVGSLRPDHCDVSALKSVLSASPQVTLLVPEAVRAQLTEKLDCPESAVVGMEDDSAVRLGSIALIGVAGEEPPKDQESGEGHSPTRLGYIAQLGPWTIYHGSGTPFYEGLEERLSRHAIDIAVLPVSDSLVLSGGKGAAMNGIEAARLARNLDVRLAIPSHYEMFSEDLGGVDEFVSHCQQLGQAYRQLRCGERWSDAEIEELAAPEDYEDELLERFGGKSRFRLEEGDE
jgi:L-ascorbate metabolism protein UlaG (beta-lactamase superfamily)